MNYSNTTDIAALFPHAKGYKTYAGAQRKIEGIVAEFGEVCFRHTTLAFRPTDGRWLPIVIMSPETVGVAAHLAARGVCVTN